MQIDHSIGWPILALLPALLFNPAHATEVYRWTDNQGHVHFGNHPPHQDRAELLFTSKSRPSPSPDQNRRRGTVKKVVDGDTVELSNGMKLRLAGINAPETAYGGKPGAPGGEAAKSYLESLIGNSKISWESAEEPRDRYGRYLTHIYDASGNNVNQRLLREGLVHVSIYPPNLNHVPEYLASEKQARAARLGIWSNPEYREFRSMEMTDARNHFRRVRLLVKTIERVGDDNLLITEDGFALLINRNNQLAFDRLTSFLGNELVVRGWVKMRKKQLYIELKHPLQIEQRLPKTQGTATKAH